MDHSTDSFVRSRPSSKGDLDADQLVSKRYRVIRRIGAGAYGTVYEVEHVALGKRFALKVLNAQAQRNWRSIARFQAEAVTASKIDHPHIVSVTDVGQTEDNQAYYVMELLEGETLAAVLKRERGNMLAMSRAIPILAATAHGLHAAHEQGIVHRDLKPENVFLVPQEDVQLGITREVVRILDFGLAKVLESPGVTVEGITYGTPGYMAPEQIRGEPVDRRVDIYSIGCFAYEMLAGRPLYTGSAMDVAMAHIEQQPAPFETPSPRMRWLVERCLRKDPTERYQTCLELLEELRSIAIELLTPDGRTKQIDFTSPSTTPLSARDSYPNLDPGSDDSWWDDFSSIVHKMGGEPSGPNEAHRGDDEGFGGETLIDDTPFGETHESFASAAATTAKLEGRPESPQQHEAPVPPAPPPPRDPPLKDALPRPPSFEAPTRREQVSDTFFPVEHTLQVDDLPQPQQTAWHRTGLYLLVGVLSLMLVVLGLLSYRVLSSGKPTGALIVTVDPEDAALALDGKVRSGKGAFRVVNDLPARGLVVSASKDGCKPKIRRLTIEKGRVQTISLKLDCD